MVSSSDPGTNRSELETSRLKQLCPGIGSYWREVAGELQERHGECALWILLYEDSDLRESHVVFCDIFSPFIEKMAPAQFTLSYSIYTDTLDVSVETLMDTAEILDARQDPSFGRQSMTQPRQSISVFQSDVSGKRPPPQHQS